MNVVNEERERVAVASIICAGVAVCVYLKIRRREQTRGGHGFINLKNLQGHKGRVLGTKGKLRLL